MADELRVYLDHLLPRENLRYQRPEDQFHVDIQPTEQPMLRLGDLFSESSSSRVTLLRKPDFQRATWAWTPDDCVSLLESIVNGQVIPSLIMWTSPNNGYDYVLDGGHRISVVLAWLNDDWGDKLPDEAYPDEEEEKLIKAAAKQVRDLVKLRVGSISDYQGADEKFERVVMEGGAPKVDLDPTTFQRAYFYRNLRRGNVGFHILNVRGDYQKAEASFLKINKSGRQLSEWETKLVENRDSSLARTIMSLASINSSKQYWPSHIPEGENDSALQEKVTELHTGISALHDLLFRPTYERPIRRVQQPFFVVPTIWQRPYYLAELLTVIERGKGQVAETEVLLKNDRAASSGEIINNGWRLVQDALDVFSHLAGPSPKSLGLVPALYFYNDAGAHVRGLLYGWIYWLFSGSEDDTLKRKRVFSAYRGAFETTLVEYKAEITGTFGRKIGSGPEITLQAAKFFQRLLELLSNHRGDVMSPGFGGDIIDLIASFSGKASRSALPASGRSRTFTPKQKSTLILATLLAGLPRCGICGGMVDPAGDVQHDHILERFRGGATVADNQRIVHPFCNNQANREAIEALKRGQTILTLPSFVDPDVQPGVQQLSFIDDLKFSSQSPG
ncbi:MAG: HNH endonuclease signature motif containing protein [Anaerolineae bacterium]